MVICYEIRKALLSHSKIEETTENELWDQERATGEQVEQFYDHLELSLIHI